MNDQNIELSIKLSNFEHKFEKSLKSLKSFVRSYLKSFIGSKKSKLRGFSLLDKLYIRLGLAHIQPHFDYTSLIFVLHKRI